MGNIVGLVFPVEPPKDGGKRPKPPKPPSTEKPE